MALTRPTGFSAAALAAVLLLAGCGGGGGDDGAGSAAADVDCAAYEQYGDLSGTTVTFYTSVVAPDDAPYIASFEPFEQCTGADVVYEGSREFEAQIVVRVQSGTPPDIALFPQPGLLQTVVRVTDAVVPAPESVAANVDTYYGEDWKPYGTVDGTFYAAPNGASVKSLVWYSPSAFAEAGYKIPQTWDEMVALSDRIVADGGKPWCVGIASGDATGWPVTDWMEDVMLRDKGPEVYDQWVAHDIPFNDPQVADVLERTGSILKNPEYVNGGFGDVRSIASTAFQDAGLPVLDGNCCMHKQSSFYSSSWPEGTTVAEDGDVWAFPLPPIDESIGSPLLTGGEFVAAFDDRPEVQAFQTYLTSPEYVNARAVEGNWTAPSTALDPENVPDPIARLGLELLQAPDATLRFDGSDLMPAEVGSASFWTEMTDWIANDKPDDKVLDAIEASWPSS
ncbi:MAG TPA: ABC transporter substrate-binding protein [Jiangellales bacterium]|nr:ABC transporter substrate-binding protein [Jiangellales bacterium]